MGLDLRLLPLDDRVSNCSFDLLGFDRDSELFEAIMKLESQKGVDVQRGGVRSFCGINGDTTEPCYGKTEFSPYGDRLKTLTAGDLYPVLVWEMKNGNWKNKAIRSFVKELPDDLPIVLYWH